MRYKNHTKSTRCFLSLWLNVCPFVLLAVHNNRNRLILGVEPRYRVIPLAISLCRYGFDFQYQLPCRISGSITGTTLKITKFHATYNDYSCPLINTGGIAPWSKYNLKIWYIGPLGRSGKAIRGFSGYLSSIFIYVREDNYRKSTSLFLSL